MVIKYGHSDLKIKINDERGKAPIPRIRTVRFMEVN